jgi:hypothetical protein
VLGLDLEHLLVALLGIGPVPLFLVDNGQIEEGRCISFFVDRDLQVADGRVVLLFLCEVKDPDVEVGLKVFVVDRERLLVEGKDLVKIVLLCLFDARG